LFSICGWNDDRSALSEGCNKPVVIGLAQERTNCADHTRQKAGDTATKVLRKRAAIKGSRIFLTATDRASKGRGQLVTIKGGGTAINQKKERKGRKKRIQSSQEFTEGWECENVDGN